MGEAFEHVPHPHIQARRLAGPVRVADHYGHDAASAARRFNARLAVVITAAVGTMVCAYLFAALALVSLPAAIKSGDLIVIVAWVAQTFIQLVLLPIIIVGQNVQAKAADARADATYRDAEAVLHEATQIQAHLAAQDQVLTGLIDHLRAQDVVLARLQQGPGVAA